MNITARASVDAHFSHLSRWIKELESERVIVSTAQLIKGLMERAASHAKGRKGADDSEKVSNVRFVEYRPACTHAPNSRFIDSAMNVEADGHNEEQLLHYVHQPILSTQTDVMPLFGAPSQPIVYDRDGPTTSQLVNSITNTSTSLLEQIERSHTCTSSIRRRTFMTMTDNRLFYSFSSQPPTPPNERVVVKAKIIGSDNNDGKEMKYTPSVEEIEQPLKFAPRLPEYTVIAPNKRNVVRMMKRNIVQLQLEGVQHRKEAVRHRRENETTELRLMAKLDAALNDPTSTV